MKLLDKKPSKGERESKYVCGISFTGGWATRLEKHREFINTPMGKYILELEGKLNKLSLTRVSKNECFECKAPKPDNGWMYCTKCQNK